MATDNLYTKEEFKGLKETLEGIQNNLPEHLTGYIWSNYQKIVNTTENKPCSCGSSAGLWRKAVETIRTYIKDNEDIYNG